MAIYQGNKELILNNVSTVKHGGMTVYARKLKVSYYDYDFTDGNGYPGYYIIPSFDTDKFKKIKFNITTYSGKQSEMIDVDKYELAMDDPDISISINSMNLSNVSVNDYNHNNIQGTRWADMFSNQDGITIRSIQLF